MTTIDEISKEEAVMALKHKLSDEKEADAAAAAISAAARSALPVTFALYKKFWRMQEFFSRQTFALEHFEEFKSVRKRVICLHTLSSVQIVAEVLTMFDNYKVEASATTENEFLGDALHQRESLDGPPSKRKRFDVKGDVYFAKYLTGQKLLQLQLNDSQFRRYVLVQLLICAQWLCAGSRFA